MSYQGEHVVYVDRPDPTTNIDDDAGRFGDAAIRKGFIRKVFGILVVQLIVTMLIIAMFIYVDEVRLYASTHIWMVWTALLLTLMMLIVLACADDIRRRTPWNFILLGLFTLFEGWMLGCFASVFSSNEVLLAVGIVTIVVIALTIFALQTKWDFTTLGGMLVVFVMVLLLFGIIAIFVQSNILNIVYASLAALIFGFYLVFDIQLMLGGKHKYSISPEEYIFAALSLYIDIVLLFMEILFLIGSVGRR
ncbi:protein lifeguard 1-like [Paramacrobiotus metropolitanus]|uniref:protein lifeguard 1-like n=1 Tax=Paramacrobiotus metropolitanus TaxID=2943436 RepID=UPI002445EFF5|nr:protein lifeguard 1-like [Paramacrobiotus metropolitanus]